MLFFLKMIFSEKDVFQCYRESLSYFIALGASSSYDIS